ncbi:MAG: hypothetical protein QOJ39_1813 [Candidatus Eremiobacteraeota bacterium]|nr:hypothetical protein [Candidatus Eremiobacteraeota bacterium]
MNGGRSGPQLEPSKARNGAPRAEVAVMDPPGGHHEAAPGPAPVALPRVESRFGPLGAFFKRLVQRLLRFYTLRQEATNAELAARISALETTRPDVGAMRRDLLEVALDFGAIADRLRVLENVRRVVERSGPFRDEVRSHRRELAEMRAQVGALSARLTLLARETAPALAVRRDIDAVRADIDRLEEVAREAHEQAATGLERAAERLDELTAGAESTEARLAARAERTEVRLAARAEHAEARIADARHDIEEVRSSAARDLAQRSVELRAVVEEVERRLTDTVDRLTSLVETRSRTTAGIADVLRLDVAASQEALRGDLEERIDRAQRAASTLRTAFDAFAREATADRDAVRSAGERLTAAQQRVDELGASVADVPARHDALRDRISGLADRVDRMDDLQRRVSDIAGALNEVRKATLELRGSFEAVGSDAVQSRLETLAVDVERLRERLVVTPYMSAPLDAWPEQRLSTADDFDYVGFEDVFRGSEGFIRERLRAYLPLLEGRAPVIELGSGRGEFLELMRESGIEAVGVDLNAEAVARCRAKGLENVVIADANAYLAGAEEGSAGAIFSAQFAEHLPFTELLRCLELARTRLAPGGTFVAETVNPNSIEAWKTFYVDPTHVKPIFPEVFVFLCRSLGFTGVRLFYPNGGGFDEAAPTEHHEYAVVATAPIPGESRTAQPPSPASDPRRPRKER